MILFISVSYVSYSDFIYFCTSQVQVQKWNNNNNNKKEKPTIHQMNKFKLVFLIKKKKKAAIYWGHGPLTESLWSLRDEAQKMDKK